MEIATTKLSSRGQIVIPADMRTDMKEGDTFVIVRRGEDILLRKERKVADLLSNIDFAWEGVTAFADENILAESWSSKEDEKAFAYLQNK